MSALLDEDGRFGADQRLALGCSACEATFLGLPAAIGLVCPRCAVGALESGRAFVPDAAPERLIPFALTPSQLAAAFQAFVAPVPLKPSGLDGRSLAARAVPIWLPMWLVDTDVSGTWTAEVGFDYQVQSTRESFRDGAGWQSEGVVEGRIRWEERIGVIQRHYANALAPALRQHARMLAWLGAPAVEQSVAAKDIGRALLWVPDLDTEAAWPGAQALVNAQVAEELRVAAAVAHLREPSLRVEYSNLHWTWLLQPAWASWYEAGGKRHPVVLGDQSRRGAGALYTSWPKAWTWSAGVFLGAAITMGLAAVVLLAGLAIPPLLLVGAGGGVIALGLALVALWPLARAWKWNSEQRGVSPFGGK